MSLATWTMLAALSLALAADAFAVAVCQGAAARPGLRGAARLGAAFGSAQALMPAAGWALGVAFASAVEAYDHWIAFALLAAIGGKMLAEGLRREDRDCDPAPSLSTWALLAAALATSIDAAAAGVTLPTLGAPILLACAVIGLVTLILSATGVFIGAAVGARIGRSAEVAGGAILILLGLKILATHLYFS